MTTPRLLLRNLLASSYRSVMVILLVYHKIMTISGTCIHVYTLVCSSSNCLQCQWCENPWVPAGFKTLISGYLQLWLTNSCTFPTVFQLGRFLGVIYPSFLNAALCPFCSFQVALFEDWLYFVFFVLLCHNDPPWLWYFTLRQVMTLFITSS